MILGDRLLHSQHLLNNDTYKPQTALHFQSFSSFQLPHLIPCLIACRLRMVARSIQPNQATRNPPPPLTSGQVFSSSSSTRSSRLRLPLSRRPQHQPLPLRLPTSPSPNPHAASPPLAPAQQSVHGAPPRHSVQVILAAAIRFRSSPSTAPRLVD
jgi:hypothetical protein